ncbi:unnamed protein product, partial [Oppiella nova]
AKRKSHQRIRTTSEATNSVSDNSCSLSSFDLCLASIQEVTQNSSLAFATNRENLHLACRKLKEGVVCADNHMKNCTNRSQKNLFEEIVNGTKQVLNLLCQTGDFQNNYLRYAQCFKNVSMSEQKCAGCFKNVSMSEQKCAGVLRRVQNMSIDPQNTSDMEAELKTFCCAFQESVECQIDFVRRDCGEKAVDFFETYLKQISSSLMHQHCISYTYHGNCKPKIDSLSNSSHIQRNMNFNFLILAVTITQILAQFVCKLFY